MRETPRVVARWMRRATGGLDVRARLMPLKPFPWLKMVLAAWEPQNLPKSYRIACGRMMDDTARPQPGPQALGEVEPAGIRQGQVSLATKLRALDGLPPAKPWDRIVDHDGRFDRDETGAYVLVHKQPKPAQRRSDARAAGRGSGRGPAQRACDRCLASSLPWSLSYGSWP